MENILLKIVYVLSLGFAVMAARFLFAFGGTQILSILRFALPFTKKLKKENSMVFSRGLYLMFFATIILWLAILGGVSYAAFCFPHFIGSLVLGAILGIRIAWRSSVPSLDKEAAFFVNYSNYICGYDTEPPKTKRSKLPIIICCVFAVIAAGGVYCGYYWYSQAEAYYALADNLSVSLDECETILDAADEYYQDEITQLQIEYESKLNNLELELEKKENSLSFYETNIAFINRDEPDVRDMFLYHTADCALLKNNYMIVSASEAQSHNFVACPHCHKTLH